MTVSHLQIDTSDGQFEIKQKEEEIPQTITIFN